MIVDRITLRLVTAELTRPFENRWQRFHTWTKLVIEAEADGVTGYGECTAMETPFYHYETTETAWYIVESFLAPAVLSTGDIDVAGTSQLWEHVYGHEEAKGGLEATLWDLQARLEGRPLYDLLGGSQRPVPVGATTGIEPTIDALLESVADGHAQGFQRVRVKIRPGWDLLPLREVRSAFPDLPVIADANAAYALSDLDELASLDELGLMAIEQPLARDSLEATAALQRRIGTPICLDESVHSVRDVEAAIRLRACGMVNVKTGRVGGLAEAVRVHDVCASAGLPTFVGGKWDQGLARWAALAVATLPGMTLPSDLGPSRSYYVDDGVAPPLELAEPGHVLPRAVPGHGAVPTGTLQTQRERHLTRSRL